MISTTIAVGQTTTPTVIVPPGKEITKVIVRGITAGNLFVEVSHDGTNFQNLQAFVPASPAGTIGTVNFNASTANFAITVPPTYFDGAIYYRFVSSIAQAGSPATIYLV